MGFSLTQPHARRRGILKAVYESENVILHLKWKYAYFSLRPKTTPENLKNVDPFLFHSLFQTIFRPRLSLREA